MLPLFEKRETVFSSCRRYRYRLRQIWEERAPLICFALLNPSTADEVSNDPTVERCEQRARSYGYGGLEVINIFAYRATDPAEMLRQDDPVGLENDAHIVEAARNAGRVVCGWGKHGNYLDRGKHVLELLRRVGVEPYCLKLNTDLTPMHPLYVGYDVNPLTISDAIKARDESKK